MEDRPILVIDGLNFFMRHFVVNPTMSESGDHVGGLVGFLKGLRLLCERVRPRRVIVAWEGGGSSRRRAIFPEYKQGRRPQKLNRFYADEIPDTVENRDTQLALLIEALRHVPVIQMYVSDCEADDVVAYLAMWTFRDEKCVIVSSDKDLYQLLSPRVIQWSPGQKAYINFEDVKTKFGVTCKNFCVSRCFVGDPSDGLPGIKGAGFKSMAKRFPDLSSDTEVSVEDIIARAEVMSKKSKIKLYKNITDDPGRPRMNWKLMNLGTSILAAYQIEKISGIINTFSPPRNKISLMRTLLREGIVNFDVDSFFMSMCAVER
jgi:protein Xni